MAVAPVVVRSDLEGFSGYEESEGRGASFVEFFGDGGEVVLVVGALAPGRRLACEGGQLVGVVDQGVGEAGGVLAVGQRGDGGEPVMRLTRVAVPDLP